MKMLRPYKSKPQLLSEISIDIVLSWKNFVSGTFYLFRYLKDHTIFLNTEEPPKAYAVLAIQSTFDEIFGGNAPIMIQTVLLPFRDKIIYDGFTMPYNIRFGANIRRSLDDSYREANARFGIITQLPFSGEEKDNAERLKAYLKTKRSRELHQEEIEALINKDRKLRILYEQEMGRIHAQAYRKRLRDNGLSNLWFGILDGVIVASGSTKGKLESNLKDILPKDKMDLVFVFQLK